MAKYLFVAVAAGLLAVGCSEVEDIDYQAVRLEADEARAWPEAGVNMVEVDNENGNVRLEADDTDGDSILCELLYHATGKDTADAQEWLDKLEVSDKLTGDELELECELPQGHGERNIGVDFEVESPSEKAAIIEVTNGNVEVKGMTAGATVTDANGNIACDLDQFEDPESAVLKTTNGNITLSLPAGVAATFDAVTTNGTTTLTGFSDVQYTTNEDKHKAGTINRGGATIDLETTNGNIEIAGE